MQASDRSAVVQRERDFHNERFSEDNREAQEKFYWALEECVEDWMNAIRSAAEDAVVLEYGCAKGHHALQLASTARRVEGIDISDVAIAQAEAEARARGIANADFSVMDAQETSFPDDVFDLVFGSGIIHHLDTEASLREIHRILRPGGRAIFKEPLGANLAINGYRRLTPSARTPDEHPLLPVDMAISRRIFAEARWDFHGLLSLAAVPFRRHGFGEPLRRGLSSIDRLLSDVPGYRWQYWYAVITLRKATDDEASSAKGPRKTQPIGNHAG